MVLDRPEKWDGTRLSKLKPGGKLREPEWFAISRSRENWGFKGSNYGLFAIAIKSPRTFFFSSAESLLNNARILLERSA
jgi:hypothetical protein